MQVCLRRSLVAAVLSALPGNAIRIRAPEASGRPPHGVGTSLLEVQSSCYAEHMGFDDFIRTYNRKYEPGSAEYSMRKGLYEAHAAAAKTQNCKPYAKWQAGINAHADWSETELASLRGYRRSPRRSPSAGGVKNAFLKGRGMHSFVRDPTASVHEPIPESLSWGHLTAIRSPRDQGQCGSCWAHAAETVMRAHSEINAAAQNFSVDELISCVPNPQECGGQGGCKGATTELAFDYATRNGLSLETPWSEYSDEVACPQLDQGGMASPIMREFFMEDGREMHMLLAGVEDRGMRISMHGWSKLPENREEPVVRALVEMGPVAVAVAAGWQWNLYKSGIMATDDSCQDQVITHAVVLFGFGVEDGTRFWQLKNSWGAWWGEDGNIRLQRAAQEEDHCDWDTKPEVGTGCLGGPPQVWVCGSCGILYDVSIPHFRPLDVGAEPPWEADLNEDTL